LQAHGVNGSAGPDELPSLPSRLAADVATDAGLLTCRLDEHLIVDIGHDRRTARILRGFGGPLSIALAHPNAAVGRPRMW
jgi:hypothetical protein